MFRRDLGHSGSTNPSGILPQGTLRSAFSTGGAIHSSTALANGTVYVGSKDGKLYALDAATDAKLGNLRQAAGVKEQKGSAIALSVKLKRGFSKLNGSQLTRW